MVWLARKCPGLLLTLCISVLGIALCDPAAAGPYRDSAHGNATYGVDRTSIDPKLANYAAGNCAHCHEMHASVDGAEPQPVGGAAPHALFARPFNTARTQQFYIDTDNFCFYCHSDTTGQQVINQDYSAAFGGATLSSGPQSILESFNQTSYHNLYDIWQFLQNNPLAPWFGSGGNPCSACHNSHLAKRNWDSGQAGFPLLSAISRPDSHSRLWGETELMSSYLSYEAPFAFGETREPAGVGDYDGVSTPDYPRFCTSCHNPTTAIWSTDKNRELKRIDWGDIGVRRDKHGVFTRDGNNQFREPYTSAAAYKGNLVLSCLDCHEPHGSENLGLLRRRINGENLAGIVGTNAADLGYACRSCHNDDQAAAAGTGLANSWEFIHHLAPGAPYAKTDCTPCHASSSGGEPISCGNCHGHGMDDSWAGGLASGRKTF